MDPLKILLVDDDDAVRHVLKIALSVEEGIDEVREAADGDDALRIVHEFKPDVIFLDYWMPRMDGRTAAGRIRQVHPEARIIAFSGVLEEKPEWADGYFVKGELPDVEAVLALGRS